MSKIYPHEEVKKYCLEYFDGDEIAADACISKYLLRDNEGNLLEKSPNDYLAYRIASEFKRIEDKYANPLSLEEIREALGGISEDDLSKNPELKKKLGYGPVVCQGSPTFGIGNKYKTVSLGNCFVVGQPLDSFGGILLKDQEIAHIQKRRGGTGIDLSTLRPRGSVVNNAAITSDGIAVFMDRYSETTKQVAQCISGDQLVLTKSGLKRIDETLIGDFVWTKSGWVIVNDVIKSKKLVYKVVTKGGYQIKTSIDHIFSSYSDNCIKEKALKDIAVGDKINLLVGTNFEKPYYELTLTDYKKKDGGEKGVTCSGGNSSRLNTDVTLPTFLDEKLAYLLGNCYGDGSVEYDRFGEPKNISIACSHKYPEIERKIIEYCKSIFNINPSVSKGDGKLNKVTISSKIVCLFLKENNLLKQKSYEIEFPESIIKSCSKVQGAFLSGYFDSDGYASGKKKGYCFSGSSLEFLRLVKTLLLSNGILSTFHMENRSHLKRRDIFSVCVVGAYSQKKLLDFLGGYSEKAILSGHISKMDKWITPYLPKDLGIKSSEYGGYICGNIKMSCNSYSKYSNNNKLPEMLVLDEVKTITEEYETDTYDLVLDEEHLFWCQGFYVHNSGRRGACLISLDCRHPDIMIFINAKRDLKRVTGANVSVKWHDDFFEALEKNEKYVLRFPVDAKPEDAKMVKEVDPKEIWKNFVDSAWESAEPGCFYWDRMTGQSITDVYAEEGFKTITTNPSLRYDTKVLTKKGIYPIGVLADKGEPIIVKNILGEWHDAIVFKSGIGKTLYKITFTNSQSVYCTKEHKWPILTTNGHAWNQQNMKITKRLTCDLKRQDKIYLPRNFSLPSNSGFTKNDGLIAGWCLGDGWKSWHKTHNTFLYGFVFSKEDKENMLAETILNIMNEKLIDKCALRENKGCFEFSSSSKNANLFFDSIGFNKKSEGIPERVWDSGDDFIKGFIDGLFSADGSVDVKSNSIVLVSSHKKLIEDVQKLLCFYGIRGTTYFSKSKAKFPNGKDYNKEYNRAVLKISTIHAKNFAETFFLSHPRKQSLLNELKNKYVGKYGKNKFGTREYLVVKSVESTEIHEDVYDITVNDNTHTFLTESGITGNCGELPLGTGGSCILMLLNLPLFVENSFYPDAKMNWDLFDKFSKTATRLIDDLVDLEMEKVKEIINKVESDPEPDDVKAIELNLWKRVLEIDEKGRKTGLGVTGLGDMLAALGIKYSSQEAIDFCKNLFERLQHNVYFESSVLAKERGPFPCWDWEKEKNNHYIKKLPLDIQEHIKKYGRRNIAHLTMSPAGTTSLMTRSTSGVEPLYKHSMIRRKKMTPEEEKRGVQVNSIDDDGIKWVHYEILHPGFERWKQATGKDCFCDSPYAGSQAYELDPKFRVKLQGIIQSHIDSSISSTVNLPKTVTKEEVSELYLLGWKSGCKGLTIYRDGSRDGVLISATSRPERISDSQAPKRPETLKCEIHESVVKGNRWIFLVGLLDGKPYEIFGGKYSSMILPKKFVKGRDNTDAIIRKNGKNQVGVSTYDLILGSGNSTNPEVYKDIASVFSPDNGSPTRLVSMLLRHGVPIADICEQIRKIPQEDSMLTFEKGISRVLRKYVADKTSAKGRCPECQSKIIYEGGCVKCSQCSWSRCD